MPDDGDWLTYREAAERLGISRTAAATRAKRLGWPRRPGNRPSDPIRVQLPLFEPHTPEPTLRASARGESVRALGTLLAAEIARNNAERTERLSAQRELADVHEQLVAARIAAVEQRAHADAKRREQLRAQQQLRLDLDAAEARYSAAERQIADLREELNAAHLAAVKERALTDGDYADLQQKLATARQELEVARNAEADQRARVGSLQWTIDQLNIELTAARERWWRHVHLLVTAHSNTRPRSWWRFWK